MGETKIIPSFIKGLFAILAGIFFIVFPDAVSSSIGLIFGIILFVMGISGAVNYIITIGQLKKENAYGKTAGAEIILVYSIITTIIGFIFVIRPNLVLQIVSLISGLFFIIDGVVKLREMTLVPKFRSFYWWFLIILSAAILVAGLFLMIYPFSGTRIIIIFCGLTFIASGIETMALSFK